MDEPPTLVASLIAGGRARRFEGTFKPFLEINGRSLLTRLSAALALQVNELIVNANGQAAHIRKLGLHCVNDSEAGLRVQQAGPLQGVAASLMWLKTNRPASPWLITLPGDTLGIPTDFTTKLFQNRGKHAGSYAVCAGKDHYLAALWHTNQLESLLNFLATGNRAVKHFHQQQGSTAVEFCHSENSHQNYFFNINTLQDYQYANAHFD